MKTIAWDVDDVLNDLMKCWFLRQWLKEHPDCNINRYDEITKNPPHDLLGVSIDEYLSSLDRFRLSPLYQEMGPVKEVVDWFEQHGQKYRHIALTSVPLLAVTASAQWVFRMFGKWIRTFHFVPSRRKGENIPEYDRDKGDFLSWASKVALIVDDSPSNIASAERVGCKGVLIPRPWNGNKGSIEESLSLILDY